VVDSYDAMTSKRNYRRNLNMEEAVAELGNCAGTQFDPQCVEGFQKALVNFDATSAAFSREYLDNFTIKQENKEK
jgi:HD-GYP domain-containing protein (c-di-GMP phosphodiesterase class II)